MEYNNQAAEIDAWIASCYNNLKQRVMMTNYFDEDVFQDTYLALREIGVKSVNKESEFIRLYRTLLTRDFRLDMRYSHPDPVFFNLLSEEADTGAENKPDPIQQAQQVDRTCKAILNDEDYNLYKLRYKIGLTLREIALYTGRAATAIYNRLTQIIQRIKAYYSPTPVRIAI